MFQFNVLGGSALEGPDGPVSGRAAHKRRLALLAVLAVARGRTISRERLLGLLWPDSPTQPARHLLSESLSVLRRELGEDVFVCRGDDLVLNREVVACDLDAFEAAVDRGDLVEAVALYLGPFLDGFYVSEAPDFERWVEGERDRLGRAYAKALEALAEERERSEDLVAAADCWRRLAIHDPYSSRVALRLVQALAAAGEREAALRHAAVHAAFVREELGTEPAAELREFVGRLRHVPPPAARESAQPPAVGESPSNEAPDRPQPANASGETLPRSPEPEESMAGSTAGEAASAGRNPAVPVDTARGGAERRTAALWFADVVGYSSLIARDADGARRVLEVLQETARREVRRGDGHLVEFIGDGVLAEFSDVDSCARAAVRLVRAFERRTREVGAPATLRVGVHFGAVSVTDDGGVYGEAVSVATRLQARADPGQVIASGEVRARVRTGVEFRFAGCGMVAVPGESAPIPSYDLRLERSREPATLGARADKRVEGPRRRTQRTGWVFIGVGLAVVLGIGVLLYLATRSSSTANPRLNPNRVAVLYLAPNSSEPELRALAKGLTDQLIHELSQVDALDVVPPSGVRPYRDHNVPLDSVALALRAGTLLEGSLARSGERLRLTLYLIDAASGERLRSTVLHAQVGDPFVLEEQLAREASRFLRWRLGRTLEVRTHSSGTRSVSARRWLLLAEQAREEAQGLFGEPDSLKIAVGLRVLAYADSLLIRAESADTRWAEPVALRGWVAVQRERHSPAAEKERLMHAALAHADRALRLRLDSPRALELRGTIRWVLSFSPEHADSADRLVDAAREDLAGAVRADPLRASAWHSLSQVLAVDGDHQGAYFAAERAFRTDAYLLSGNLVRQRLFRSALAFGRFDLAREQCAVGARDYPSDWRFVECPLVILGRVDQGPVDVAAAETALRRINEFDPPRVAWGDGRAYLPIYRQMLFAAVLARAGKGDSARAILARARGEVESHPEMMPSFLYDEAHVRLFLGDRDGAVIALHELVRRQPSMAASVANDYLFRTLRADLAFRGAVRSGAGSEAPRHP